MDIDNFKCFNDTYGHLYGNTVLHMVDDELKNGIGTEGRVARWGGDGSRRREPSPMAQFDSTLLISFTSGIR